MGAITPALRLCSQNLRNVSHPNIPLTAIPFTACRYASGLSKLPQGAKRTKDQAKKKKKARKEFRNQDLKNLMQFSLCDAMRCIRAFEVGRSPTSTKYDLAIRLDTLKNAPVVRNRLRLPHAVDNSVRICVICPPDSPFATQARNAGASLVGEETVFDAVKEGLIEFDRCLCHVDSAAKMNKAGLGKMLGPRGLMPSEKFGTIVKDVAAAVKGMVGGTEYRERLGVVRCAVGQLGFTPAEMQNNIKALMSQINRDIRSLSEKVPKAVHEVVLSSTNAPGFSLNGDFRSPLSPSIQDLSVL